MDHWISDQILIIYLMKEIVAITMKKEQVVVKLYRWQVAENYVGLMKVKISHSSELVVK